MPHSFEHFWSCWILCMEGRETGCPARTLDPKMRIYHHPKQTTGRIKSPQRQLGNAISSAKLRGTSKVETYRWQQMPRRQAIMRLTQRLHTRYDSKYQCYNEVTNRRWEEEDGRTHVRSTIRAEEKVLEIYPKACRSLDIHSSRPHIGQQQPYKKCFHPYL